MIRKRHIAALILLWFLASGKSCDNEERFEAAHEQKRVSILSDSLRSVFGTDTLSSSAMHAFEESALMKANDLFDYLHILSDSGTSVHFKDKAAGMIRGLFISDKTRLRFAEKSRADPDSILLTQSLQRANDSVYTGRLNYVWIPHGLKPEGKSGRFSVTESLNFIVMKHRKIFGSDTLRIWEVFLGDPQ